MINEHGRRAKTPEEIEVNLGQHTTREEAIRLYTVNNGWFLKEEEPNLAFPEVGKFGDVVVLSDDDFNPVKVPMN